MITANTRLKVKLLCRAIFLCASLFLGTIQFSNAQQEENLNENEIQSLEQQEFGIGTGKEDQPQPKAKAKTPLEDYQPLAEAPNVKPIEAEDFQVKFKKKSKSGQVLLFEDLTENRPKPGKILLIKRDSQKYAVVRVLKTMPGQFAAKVLELSKDFSTNDEYRAIKKLSDKITVVLDEKKKNRTLAAQTDEDLAKEVEPSDAELDRGIPIPVPEKKPKKKAESKRIPANTQPTPEPLFDKDGNELDNDLSETEENDPITDVALQDNRPWEPNRHLVTAAYSQLTNVDSSANPAKYTGAGIRYSYNLWHPLFLKRRPIQDILSLELSFYYYTITGFLNPDDQIAVVPLVVTTRYSLIPGESFSFFTYLGLVKNFASQAEGKTIVDTVLLASVNPAIGVGLMIRIGPNWTARIDVGFDQAGIGAALKF